MTAAGRDMKNGIHARGIEEGSEYQQYRIESGVY